MTADPSSASETDVLKIAGDHDEELRALAPVMKLLDQAREAMVTPLEPSPTPADVPPPPRLGDYELLSPIGRGGMGVVYEARQCSLDRIVALKVLPKSVLPGSEHDLVAEDATERKVVQRFHIEARAAARLHHSNIVPVYGFGEDAGFYFFVMQRIYGKSLDRWFEQPVGLDVSLPVDDRTRVRLLAHFGRQAASGLAYAHAEGILHRDIKPANLLVDQDLNVQIADFGVARIDDADAVTRTSDVVGTLRYMSPEQLAGESCPQSDVYSLGVTLYELATGVPAVNEASVRQAILLQKMPTGPVPLSKCAPSLPLDLRTIIEKAMAPELSHRYPDARALAEDLSRFNEGRPILARRLSWHERSARWLRKNRMVSTLTALLLAAVTLTAVVAISGQARISQTLDQEMKTSRLATDAMHEIFKQYSTTADSMSLDFDADDYSAPLTDPRDAVLFEDLLEYYSELAAQPGGGETQTDGNLDAGLARAHLGTIQHQLGRHEAALQSFEQALTEIPSDHPLLRARVQNKIGITLKDMGRLEPARQSHKSAIATLQPLIGPEASPRARFELARSKLLLAIRGLPRTGPTVWPPPRAFRPPLSKRSGVRGRRLPGRAIFMMRNSATPLPTDGPSSPELFREAMQELQRLHREVPDSHAVTLMLAAAVREALGPQVAGPQQDFLRWHWAEEAHCILSDQIWQRRGTEQDAAFRYELARLLTNVDVLRPMNSAHRKVALRRINAAQPHLQSLVDRFPGVSAYERLSIEAAVKEATLQLDLFDSGEPTTREAAHGVRERLQQAMQRQQRLRRVGKNSGGEALWCTLILMQLGDIQARVGANDQAIRFYQRAIRLLPIDYLDQPPTRSVAAESPPIRSTHLAAVRQAGLVLLERFRLAARSSHPELAQRARVFADRLAAGEPVSKRDLREAIGDHPVGQPTSTVTSATAPTVPSGPTP
ncbi:serine/threonine protein kinase [Roseiconus nitratireducens]|uniref:Serine/threonine protein kinase n=1 Tax=Roseiconus nitratireducens TaxID=2605748 RepID=A0A5M6DN81_9BACT|nr:serine/threonine-protein kinase [Roseiconus nitratireducens]KAA5546875.1 serine/threonine protein kinase [Roseiconus nitratireducens]